MGLTEFLKNEAAGWKKWEIAWLCFVCVLITSLSIYWKDTAMGIISAVSGAICVVCTGKGKLSAYIFGTVNVILYAVISYHAKYYGEVMLNVLYYLPMEFYGFYVWNKHMNNDTHEVIKRKMTTKHCAATIASIVAGTIIYGFLLGYIGGSLPFLDAFTTVSSVVAMLVSVKMYKEQWIIWVVIDAASIVMWMISFLNGSENIATVLMWAVYLGNAIIMYVKWSKEAQDNAA